METRKTNGYLISGACAVTDSSLERLLRANPDQLAENYKIERIALDTRHELWVLARSDASPYQAALEQLRQQNTELAEALRACEYVPRYPHANECDYGHDLHRSVAH